MRIGYAGKLLQGQLFSSTSPQPHKHTSLVLYLDYHFHILIHTRSLCVKCTAHGLFC